MERIARFEKVSKERFILDHKELFKDAGDAEAHEAYSRVSIPKRATKGSAGYDLITPVDVCLRPGEGLRIPTGIRVRMRADYCMLIVPRSGLGSRFRFQLDNTVGVIDSDYYGSANEGHIFVPMRNDSRDGKDVNIKAGTAFAQCIFMSYGITEDDETIEERNGGFGSTG